MKKIIFVVLLIFAVMETNSQNTTTDRQAVAAGRFYPADKEALSKDVNQLFKSCIKSPESKFVRAIISPHAGYVYSGKITASAISTLSKSSDYKNIFIIGSSHVMSFEGASVYNAGDYITPLGRVKVNREIANKLINENKEFRFPVTAHVQEHSIEVQLPFLQSYFDDLPLIVPIIIGTGNENTLKRIADELRPWFTSENLFLISSDFSHYPAYNEAIKIDKLTAASISSGESSTFLHTLKTNSSLHVQGLATSMCGWTSGLILLYLSEENKQLEYNLVDYCNSGDSRYGNKDEVVGYNAMVLTENRVYKSSGNIAGEVFSINEEEKKYLFDIARGSITSMLNEKKRMVPDEKAIPEKLKIAMGAFVTIKIDGSLRGCIGRFFSSDPLYEVVQASALSSAFEDPRFAPLSSEEYEKCDLEITVLGPMKKINDISEIVLGKHGIYIKKDARSGTMLPQVAIENKWSVEEFLGYTAREKAGIGWDGWKDADIFIYEGVVLEDNKK